MPVSFNKIEEGLYPAAVYQLDIRDAVHSVLRALAFIQSITNWVAIYNICI